MIVPSQTSKGFSLLELVAGVSILGILTTLSYTSFQKYRLTAYRTQAKTEMAALYQAMQTFQNHFGVYFGDFQNIGYDPDGTLNFRIGFNDTTLGGKPCPAGYGGPGVAPGAVAVASNSARHCPNTGLGGSGRCVEGSDACTLNIVNMGTAANPTFDQGANTFTIGVCRNIKNAGNFDTWTMDQNQQITHVRVAN